MEPIQYKRPQVDKIKQAFLSKKPLVQVIICEIRLKATYHSD